MLSRTDTPKTKQELVRALQKQSISQIRLFDPYDPADAKTLTKTAKEMVAGSGEVTVILVKTK